MRKGNNRNDRIYTAEDVKYFPLLEDTPELDDFIKIGEIIPNVEAQRLDVKEALPIFYEKEGMVYAFIIDDRVFKLGKTEVTMLERLKSYNCGKIAYRDNGTCSTTNYMVLQSFLNINKQVDVYGIPIPSATFIWKGKKITTDVSPAKYIEREFLKKITETLHAKLPGCTQK